MRLSEVLGPKPTVILLLVAFSITGIWIPSLTAQSAGTGALTGTVTDSSGAVVPNVTVTATQVATGQPRSLTTGASGLYKFSLLPPGEYRVKFAGEGFRSIEVPAVVVNVTETTVLNRSLDVGVQSESVTVQASGAAIDTATSTLGTLVDSLTVETLPLTSRNYTQILNLSAGVSDSVNNATTLGRGTTKTTSVNGSTPGQNNYQMDGVAVNSVGNMGNPSDQNGTAGIPVPSPDAIEEFKVQTSTYDASYGRNPGANVNVVTKSGSGHYHGTIFEFLRNTALNANNYFYDRDNPLAKQGKKQVLNQNQFGGTFGGPIKKNRVFFFTSYQGTRQKNGIAPQGMTSANLPPIPDDRTSSTFAAALGAANCHFSTLMPVTNVACDGSNINPVALKILQLKKADGSWYFPGSGTTGYKQVAFSDPARFTEDQFVVNGDYLLNQKHTLQTKYMYSRDPTIAPMGSNGGNMPGEPATISTYNHNALIRLTSMLSNTFTNEVHVAYQRNAGFQADTQPANSTPADLGMNTLVPTPHTPWLYFLTGGIQLFNGYNPRFQITNQVEFADQIAWSRGKHTIRAGGEYERDTYDVDPGVQRGYLQIGTFNDFLVGQAGNIYGCGACAIGTGPMGQTVHSYRMRNTSLFVQDDWKVNQRLTINLGLRWEYFGAFTDIFGHLTDVWPNLLATVPVPPSGAATTSDAYVGWVVPGNYQGTPPAGVKVADNNNSLPNHPPYGDVAPRFGFAWQPNAKGNLVLRGGFGLFYDRVWADSMVRSFTQSPPYATTFNTSWPNTETLQNPFPTPPVPLGSFPPRWANFTTGQTSALSAYFLGPDLHNPLVRSYNLNLQYEFAPKWTLEVGYVGSSGINLLDEYRNHNTAQIATPSHPVNGLTTTTVANVNLRVPYLGWTPVGLQGTEFDGKSNYNSLQVTMRKQFSHGLTMQAAYTWSKALSDLLSGGLTANSNRAEDMDSHYGPSDFNHPQRLIVNYNYELPLGTHHGVVGRLLNSWSVSGITTVQGGTPLTFTDARAGTAYGVSGTARAQLCPGITAANILASGSVESRLNGYFNSAAFCAAPIIGDDGKATGFGNSGIGTVLGPGQFNWDITLNKGFKITEAQVVSFRTEFYNAFNHPQFANPSPAVSSAACYAGSYNASSCTLGRITNTSVNPRIIQFSLRYSF